MMEFAQLLSQVILPIALALMMFAMGLSLTLADFRRVIEYPKAFFLGVAMQLVLLPLLAWGLLWLFEFLIVVPMVVASGIIILAACPGGATSNIISHLAGGDGALSITITAFVSLLVPFILPFTLAWQLSLLAGDGGAGLQLPIARTLLQLVAITIVPVLLAMAMRHYLRQRVLSAEPLVKRFSSLLFVLLVLALMVVNWQKLASMGWVLAALSLCLCILMMLLAERIACAARLALASRRTLMIETGIQNAGTGIFICAVLLQDSQLALVPLIYGLLMNIPALLLIVNQQRKAMALRPL